MRWPAALALSVPLLAIPLAAQAYIDPGTGSYLVQALVAAAMGSALAVKTYWHRIKGLFSRGAAPPGGDAGPADRARPSSAHPDGK